MSMKSIRSAGRVTLVTTSSGLEGWLIPMPEGEVIALDFAFDRGASSDPDGQPGLAHLVSGLMDEGAGDLDAEAFQTALEDRAISLSFSAAQDNLTGGLLCLKRHLDKAVELAALALNAPRFDADAVARVKDQVLAGLRRESQQPAAKARDAFFAAAFAGHPYARPVKGTEAALKSVTRDDIAAHASALLTRENLKIVCAGPVTPEIFADLIERLFAGLPATTPLAPVPQATFQGQGQSVIVDVEVPQTSLRYGAPGLVVSDPDFIPATVVNHILGGSAFTSRYFNEVREKRGLAYSVGSYQQPLKHGPFHGGATATKNDRAAESLEVMKAEMASLAGNGPSDEELDAAKRYLTGSYALRFDTTQKIAGEYLNVALMGFAPDYVERRNGLFEAVGAGDAVRAAQRLYGDGRVLVAAAGKPVGL
jgi:zinc protease